MKKKSDMFIMTKIFKAINITAVALALLSVNSTCVWVHHQPKIPDELVKKERIYEKNGK